MDLKFIAARIVGSNPTSGTKFGDIGMIKTDIKFLECDTPNQNGRIYPKVVMEKAVLDYYPLIQGKRSLGCFASDIASYTNGGAFDASNCTHIITRLEFVNNMLFGDIEILSTPKGLLLQQIIDNPDTLFGPRGRGHIDANGVISNYQLHAIDVFIESAIDKATQQKVSANYAYDRAMGIVKK